jgi:hypothetical protein
MTFPSSDLTDACRRVYKARDRLELQRQLILKLWTRRRDTNAAEAVFRTLRQALETSQERQRRIEDKLVRIGRVRMDQGIRLGGR